jgi:three-Cys-motif partner protein
MNPKKHGPEDLIGKWSEEKLQLFEKYLRAYANIMNNQKKIWLKAYHYIDAFAGSGQSRAKDEERYVEGSPLRALQCKPPFDGYWFIELSPWRVERLQTLRKEFPDLQINIHPGDCNEILGHEIVPKITYASKQRGLVFLDPYGLQVTWEAVTALAKAKTFDVFVNFPLMAVTRLLRRNEPPKGEVAELLSKVMGSADWVQVIYRPSDQLSLFGEQLVIRDIMRAEWLARVYADQIGKLFPFVSKPVIMTNSKNVPLYSLFLASHNKTAAKIANDIFGRHERLREVGR